MNQKIYQHIASAIQAEKNCDKTGNKGWQNKWSEKLDLIEEEHLPKGSGIDNGCLIDREKSNDQRIIIQSAFHCMNENGYYDGWIDFTVKVTPTFYGIDLKITGKFSQKHGKYAATVDYLHDLFYHYLSEEVDINM